MKEKRQETRLKEENKIILRILTNGHLPAEKDVYFCLTKDISPGGVRIISDAPLPLEKVVKLEIALPKSRKLVIGTAKVRWVKALFDRDVFEIGLEFIDVHPEGMGAVLEHIYGKGPL
jgi:hypothetical protein